MYIGLKMFFFIFLSLLSFVFICLVIFVALFFSFIPEFLQIKTIYIFPCGRPFVSFNSGIARCPGKCANKPCKCCEDNLKEYCQNTCHSNGCNQCDSGTFKWNYQYYCEPCGDIFGDACLFCQDSNGCGQCKQGYDRIKDDISGLYYCKPNDNSYVYVKNCG